jgi:hypothetical protein
MTPAPQVGTTVCVHFRDANMMQTFVHAEVKAQESSPYRAEPPRLMVMRGDDMLGSFDRDEVRYWYIEEAEA